MYIIGFESSCDETAVAIVEEREGRLFPVCSRVRTQIPLHRLYGGVVPEIAGRAHIEAISALTAEALEEAKLSPRDLGCVAVTSHPGLIGALLVGVNFAKSFAFANGLPLVEVDHMKAHMAAAYVEMGRAVPKPPFLGLAVSGGHTSLYLAEDYNRYREIGGTRDDAIGEAFDKVGRLLGLPYPAGAEFDSLAARGYARLCGKEGATLADYRRLPPSARSAYPLPSPALRDGSLDFSFSGLKTAAVNLAHTYTQKGEELDREAFAAAYTAVAVEAVATHIDTALATHEGLPLVMAGGVAANSHLRLRMEEVCRAHGRELYVPPLSLCGDNGLMVAAQGWFCYREGQRATTALNASAADF